MASRVGVREWRGRMRDPIAAARSVTAARNPNVDTESAV